MVRGHRGFDPRHEIALQRTLMKFADRTSDYIIFPAIGTKFDSVEEGYEYYNLYSWECGFGIRMERSVIQIAVRTRAYLKMKDISCPSSSTVHARASLMVRVRPCHSALIGRLRLGFTEHKTMGGLLWNILRNTTIHYRKPMVRRSNGHHTCIWTSTPRTLFEL
uniref:Uncharacterized protein n=1 Tax=Arundo donax TaxID=35708 RepID=A0A0A9A731_ARUDO